MSLFAACNRSGTGTKILKGLGKQLRRQYQHPLSQRSKPFSSLNASESVLFPDEKRGKDYATNWAVASCGVSVSGSAYRNLNKAGMKKFKKSLEISAGKNAEYFGGIDADTFSDIVADTCVTLSNSENLFLSDIEGAGDVRVRAVTDDAAFANALQQILPTASVEAQNFNAVVSLVHSSVDDAEAPGPYVAVGNGLVVVRGSVSTDMVKKGLTEAAEAKVGTEQVGSWKL